MGQITVLLATCRRAAILRQTLEAMARMAVADLTWELLVVDNAGEEATHDLCQSFHNRLPLRYLVCTTPGKNAALNHGLREAAGELIVFTDDDVLPEERWLQEMWHGANRWPDSVLFGGRVLPNWPGKPPSFALNPAWDRWTYGIHDPGLAEGPSSSSYPMGVNMAVRRRVFQAGETFSESIGPKGHNYAMGSEMDLILRLLHQGHQPVFLPNSLVHHIIRSEQMDREWLIKRAFRQGRGEVRLGAEVSWYSVARLVKQAVWKLAAYYGALLRRGRVRAFSNRMSYSLARGRLYEAVRWKLEFR